MPPGSQSNLQQHALEGRVRAVEDRQQEQAEETGRIMSELGELKTTVGRPPNRLSGDPGTGIAAIAHRLDTWLEREQHRRSLPMQVGRAVVTVILPILFAALAFAVWASQHLAWR